ncbi:MAG: 16S rRNA (cytosine(1402)-N(4))-methyltransferase RsmH [Burkholderiales bacterium]|nr:16S rRNA (cytosine(1402)-N(4))-methyltransferase RsmH [Burkholderiales bacterium]
MSGPIAAAGTPAPAAHLPVMLAEAIEALQVQPDGIYVDCTFGRGGHSRAILQRLGSAGRVIAMDKDIDAIAAAHTLADRRLDVLHEGYAQMAAALHRAGIEHVNGILLDLGISSPQLDTAARGFSFSLGGPLDMRMDQSRGETAAEWLAGADEAEISAVIKTFGEERYAKRIARTIVEARALQPIATTQELAALVAKAVPTREPHHHPATRTFQAIRIYLNRELEELSAVLPQCIAMLMALGRLVVISFHSLEDRIVKRFMRDNARGDAMPSRLPLRAAELPKPRLRLIGKAIRASAAELVMNPRSRSATLRVAERI